MQKTEPSAEWNPPWEPLSLDPIAERVHDVCEAMKFAGIIPELVVVRGFFSKPYSHTVRNEWKSWCDQNKGWLLQQKGTRESLQQLCDALIADMESLRFAYNQLNQEWQCLDVWLNQNHPNVWASYHEEFQADEF